MLVVLLLILQPMQVLWLRMQLVWSLKNVRRMNSIRNRAEEIIKTELIFV